MSAELLRQGVGLMLVGMGVVFSLLGLLVLALKVMSRVAGMFEPPRTVAETSGGSPGRGVDDSELIAAVTAAIRANREEAQK